MEFSDALATTALVVSIVSAWLSHKAHRESTQFSAREARREFERERSEFLIRIERSIKLFERSASRITYLLTSFEEHPMLADPSLGKVAKQLGDDLAYLQGCLRQSRSLWEESFEISHDGLAHHKARHLALLEDDEKFAAAAMDRADRAEKSLDTYLFLKDPIVG